MVAETLVQYGKAVYNDETSLLDWCIETGK